MSGPFFDNHLADRCAISGAALPVRLPPLLARAAEALRAVPLDNPAWGSDALLVVASAWNEAAIAYETHLLTGQADAARGLAEICRSKAEQARALAPVFAPPAAKDTAP